MTGSGRRRLAGVGLVLCTVALAGCNDFTSPSASGAQRANGSSAAHSSASAPVVPSLPFVTAACDGLGGLMSDLQAFSDQLSAQTNGTLDQNPGQAQQLAELARSKGKRLAERAAAAQKELAAAQAPDFEGGAQFAQRAATALTQVQQAITAINAKFAGLKPGDPDYTTAVAGQLMGFALAYMPLVGIMLDENVMENNAGEDPTQMIVDSPGSVGFYREARNQPSCAPFFTGFDSSHLDAVIGPN